MHYITDVGGAFAVILVVYHLFEVVKLRIKRRQHIKKHGCQPPSRYAHKDPILGLDIFINNIQNIKRHQQLDGLKGRYETYGTTYSAKSFGKNIINTVDPQNLQAFYSLNFRDYGVQTLRRPPTLPFLGEGVFNMDGPIWDHSRSLIRPTFTRANVANFPAFEIHFQKFLTLIPRDGATTDLKPLLYKLFLDTSTDFLFGESMNSMSSSPNEDSRAQKFLDSFHYAQRGIGIRLQLGKLRFLYRDKKWQESIEVAHRFADVYVEKAMEFRRNFLAKNEAKPTSESIDEEGLEIPESGQPYVLLHEMAKETDDRIELRNQALHVFLAGHEATAITIGHAMFHLSRNPESWQKLRTEVLMIGQTPFTYESLKNMHYLQYVIKESLRLNPVAPTNSRMAYKDTVLPTGGGPDANAPIFIEKGSFVNTSYHALHRLAPCFQPDPEAFRPERWAEATLRPGWNYLPFGGGPRMCPGRNLGLTETAYVLARMAQEWEAVECKDDVFDWVEELKLTANSLNGIKVAVRWQ